MIVGSFPKQKKYYFYFLAILIIFFLYNIKRNVEFCHSTLCLLGGVCLPCYMWIRRESKKKTNSLAFSMEHFHKQRLRWCLAGAMALVQVLLAARRQRVDFRHHHHQFTELVLKLNYHIIRQLNNKNVEASEYRYIGGTLSNIYNLYKYYYLNRKIINVKFCIFSSTPFQYTNRRFGRQRLCFHKHNCN